MNGRVPNGRVPAHIPIIGQVRRDHPEVGSIFPVPTPTGIVLMRVEKASPYRTTLVPLSVEQELALVAEMQEAATYEARDRLGVAIGACAAHLWLSAPRPETEGAEEMPADQLAKAIVDRHPLRCPYFLKEPANRCVRANDGHEQHAFPEVPSAE